MGRAQPLESMRRVGGATQDDGRSDSHARVGHRRTAVFVSELALSAGGRRFEDRLHEGVERSPYRLRRRYCVWTRCEALVGADPDQAGAGAATRWPMAEMKPTSSRAIAVITTSFGLPVAASRR